MQGFIPSRAEIKEVRDFIDRLKARLTDFYSLHGLAVELYEVGSTAKGTFVSGDFDVDVYVITDEPDRAYVLAEHLFPQGKRKYGELLIWHFLANRFDVDLVFARRGYVKEDTLKHPAFFREALTPEMKREVVRAKAYFKTVGVYSAEVGGITGVCLEELIRRHGNFDSVCKFLAESVEKPFIQDPVMAVPRNLMASVTPRRWRQIQEACREFLATKRAEYRPFSEADFRRRYAGYAILEFKRRRDRAVDFFTADSAAFHIARMLRNLEPEAQFEHDAYVTEDKVLVALNAYPESLSETKEVCMHLGFREAVESFKQTHPDFYQRGQYLCVMVKRKFTKPLETYVSEVKERMKRRGYKEIWAKFLI